MLSAAHILAMNAKNLLDVVDHVRIRHPHVNVLFSGLSRSQDSSAGCSTTDKNSYQISLNMVFQFVLFVEGGVLIAAGH